MAMSDASTRARRRARSCFRRSASGSPGGIPAEGENGLTAAGAAGGGGGGGEAATGGGGGGSGSRAGVSDGGAGADEANALANFSISAGAPWLACGMAGANGDGAGEDSNGDVSNREGAGLAIAGA